MGISIPLSKRFCDSERGRSRVVVRRRRIAPIGYFGVVGGERPARCRRWLPTFVVFVLVFGGASVYARGTDEEFAQARYDLARELGVETLEYRIVPGVIVASEVPDEGRSVLGTYVRIVRDIVGDVPVRYVPEEERFAYARRRIDERAREIDAAIDERVLQIERERLQRESDDKTDPPSPDTDDQIASLEDDKAVLESL